jgi:GMP synthase-like glutamine amidotransferase
MASCLVIQHVAPEGPYAIGAALERLGVTVDVRRTFAGDRLPADLEGVDGLVVMGGPMSAASDEGFASRTVELTLIIGALEERMPVLGVCLGAQLLALAAGGRVYPGARGPEIGWGEVSLTEQHDEDPLLQGLPDRLNVLHWHGDTFDLPPSAVLLASNQNYPAQAFRLAESAWGVQFHLEIDELAVAAFLEAFGKDAERAGFSPDAIRTATPAALEALTSERDLVLGRFANLVASRDRQQLVER